MPDPRIGLIVGREWSFPPAFIDAVKQRGGGVVAEYCSLDATPHGAAGAVHADHRPHLARGRASIAPTSSTRPSRATTVVNNPFMWSADDKFIDATLAVRHGVAHPKTMVLPNKDYIAGISHSESLRNLAYPLDWKAVAEHIGFPCVLKDAHGGGWRDVYICQSMEELLSHYNDSGLLTMVVQEFVKWEQYVRCMVLGREHVLVDALQPRGAEVHHRSGLPVDGAARPDRRRCADALPRARLRHEHGGVRRARRRAVRHRLHEPGAGHGRQLAHAHVLRVGGGAHGGDGRSGWPRCRPTPCGRRRRSRRWWRRTLPRAASRRRRSPPARWPARWPARGRLPRRARRQRECRGRARRDRTRGRSGGRPRHRALSRGSRATTSRPRRWR